MDNDRRFESVFSKKVRAGKRRTYFFDVRRTKGDDFYLTLTESTKRFNDHGYERHKIFLYKEDFNRFLGSLEEVIDYIKTELMPDYDYEEFDRRHEEWEARQEEEGYNDNAGNNAGNNDDDAEEDDVDDDDDAVNADDVDETEEVEQSDKEKTDDDMTW